MTDSAACPDCGHPWGSHQGNNKFYVKCVYHRLGGPCPCRNMDPEVEAENRRAAWLWNSYLGRKP